MSCMLEHMDAYYLRRILRRLIDKEMDRTSNCSSWGREEIKCVQSSYLIIKVRSPNSGTLLKFPLLKFSGTLNHKLSKMFFLLWRSEDICLEIWRGLIQPSDFKNGLPKPTYELTVKGGDKVKHTNRRNRGYKYKFVTLWFIIDDFRLYDINYYYGMILVYISVIYAIRCMVLYYYKYNFVTLCY
ncbi:unnamed protein product [Trifolium pratense]|uniref:Uncharacterized protein n=1 Tax=Trifolium pratense TaxID=57577 RepID=A0ACB0JV28_TRIPR|nr:unnamed protein product [Trifolium pratense]